jgi:hypothetical protein
MAPEASSSWLSCEHYFVQRELWKATYGKIVGSCIGVDVVIVIVVDVAVGIVIDVVASGHG